MTIYSWEKLAGAAAADEATVELQLVLPLLALLGYGNEDIAPKHSVIFQEGRKGRPHEADFVIFNGRGRSKADALLVVEAKKCGESLADARLQAESYAANVGAPLLLCTNGETIEVWQMQLADVSERVVTGQVAGILSLQSKLEVLLRKEAAVEYKRQIQRPPLAGKGPDLSAYLKQQLEAFKDHGIERRLKFGQSNHGLVRRPAQPVRSRLCCGRPVGVWQVNTCSFAHERAGTRACTNKEKSHTRLAPRCIPSWSQLS